jgi:dihydrofolate reductase
MGTVGAGFSMSLDGFIAGPNDDTTEVFSWMFAGNTDVSIQIGEEDMALKMSEDSAEQYQESFQVVGAIISGRRLFDVAEAWGGKHPMNVPIVVLTHSVPEEWVYEGSPFTFVTEGGIEGAVAKAKEIAGDKNVGIGGADVTRQALKAGLLEEIGIDLVPVLLGDGVPFFQKLGIEPVHFEITSVTPGTGVTHLRYRVKK